METRHIGAREDCRNRCRSTEGNGDCFGEGEVVGKTREGGLRVTEAVEEDEDILGSTSTRWGDVKSYRRGKIGLDWDSRHFGVGSIAI